MTFGARIAARREQMGWSQRELGKVAEVPHTVISELERGLRDTAGTDVAKKLALALGVSVDWLIDTWGEVGEAAARQATKVRRGRRPSRVK